MSVFFFAIRWALLIALLWSTCVAVQDFLYLKAGFSPVVTLCAIGLAVYFGGLAGYLQLTTYFILAITTLCLARLLWRQKKSPMVWRGIPIIEGCYLLGTLLFFWVLYHDTLIHYDNFTHWGLVVKEMLITHAFPTADSALIEFTNYPTGTASWIYFVCTVVGHGENSMIMAQGLLIFAAIYAIYGVIEERRRFLLTCTLTTGLSLLTLFNYSVRINNLLVDFLLPVLTLAAVSIIYRYRKEPESLFLFPIMGFLMVVKSTGIIYASVAMIYLVYVLIKYSVHSNFMEKGHWNYRALGKLWVRGILSLSLSILPLVLWNIHTDTVFAGVVNKFETDLDIVTADTVGKTQDEIDFICQLFWDTLTDITQRGTIGILLFQFLAVTACIIGCCVLKKKWGLPKALLAMDLMLIGYLAGILAMYLYSMPMDEAIYLAAFDRYSSSIVILFGGVLTITLTTDIEHSFYYRVGEVDEVRSFKSVRSKSYYLRGCGLCIIVSALILTSEYNGMVYQEASYQGSLSNTVKSVVGDNWSEGVDHSNYLIIASDEDGLVSNYYLKYVARYYLRAPNVDPICLLDEENFLDLLSQYDYLVIAETSEHTQTLMNQYFGLSGDTGIYDLSPLSSPSVHN